MRSFSPDRPGKSQSPYTVDAGHFQIESDFLTYTHDVTAGQSTRSVRIGAPVLKAGLTNWVDFEMGFALYYEVRTTDRGSGNSTTARGLGDVQIGSKINLLGNDGGEQALALLPFVKLPTASQNLGNGSVEYTVNMPYSRALPDDWNMTLEPVVSILRNAQNSGYHAGGSGGNRERLSFPAVRRADGIAGVIRPDQRRPAQQDILYLRSGARLARDARSATRCRYLDRAQRCGAGLQSVFRCLPPILTAESHAPREIADDVRTTRCRRRRRWSGRPLP